MQSVRRWNQLNIQKFLNVFLDVIHKYKYMQKAQFLVFYRRKHHLVNSSNSFSLLNMICLFLSHSFVSSRRLYLLLWVLVE